jgi:hypothetical protein
VRLGLAGAAATGAGTDPLDLGNAHVAHLLRAHAARASPLNDSCPGRTLSATRIGTGITNQNRIGPQMFTQPWLANRTICSEVEVFAAQGRRAPVRRTPAVRF